MKGASGLVVGHSLTVRKGPWIEICFDRVMGKISLLSGFLILFRVGKGLSGKARWDEHQPSHRGGGGSHIDMVYVYVPAFGFFFAKFGIAIGGGGFIRDKGAQIT